MTEGGHSGACRMLRRLVATNRWAVTGTPMTRGDLRPVLEFLRVPLDGTDVKAIQDSQGGTLRLLPLMKCLLWRVWKVDVLDQLKMHGLVQHVVWQELSAVEMFGYRRLEESIRKEAQGSLARRGASRNAVTYLWDLTRLLQLQCVHQDLRMKQKTSYTGRKAKSFTDVKYSTFEQNVKALMAGATNRAEEALRNLVAAWNGQAGLLKLKGEDEAARLLYSKALEAEKKYGTRVDKVQKIHALVHSEASPREVEGETERFLAATSVPIRAHSANYYKLREQLPSDSSQWWLVAAPTLQGPMAAAYFQQDLREIDGHVGKIVEALESIPLDSPPEHLVTESICCEKCRGKGRPGRSCFFCRLNPHFEGYQRVARLPRFKKIGYEAASGLRPVQVLQSDTRHHGLPAKLVRGLQISVWLLRRTQAGSPRLPVAFGRRYRALIVWGPEELELKLVELQAEENDAEVKLRRNLGHLRFLKTQLPTESEDRLGLELCPVCVTEKPTTVCMLPCGHSYCQQCITTLLQRGRGSLRCPECRVFTRRNEIGHIAGEPPEPEEANSSPAPSESLCEGSVLNEIFTPIPEWGTRISSVTLLVKHITEALGESVCVFSKWVPVLHLLGSALKTNKVPFVFWSVGRLKMVERFFDGRVRVLLCPLASAGQGLNLTVASHAILLEPPAKYSQAAQAAARIWRLGQEKEATVWHFVSCRTVEEAMWTLSRRTDEEEDAELLRDIFSGLTGERVS
ncbi:hypothetical protein FOZ60_011477 [Perkinsus olseni]|uniref:RING-type domain-containing protein n=1 Tax=Perkinsus olseni TaxID=32597 RepID=A0A7J6PD10_PEROL|nr:hypothetical protein FOZ60_011477 [Perkinsus olseni]